MMEHGMLGRRYGEAGFATDVRLECHGIDRDDNDFVIGLIGAELHALSKLVKEMRTTRQTSEFIAKMGPFFRRHRALPGAAVRAAAGRRAMTAENASTSDREPAGTYDKLPLPDTGPRGLLRHFGPGLILMMTGIGTSHLVTAPAAGGRFGYALLWCIPVAYIFKYYGFEMAFRFTNATGRSMLDAYTTAPGKWPVWYVLNHHRHPVRPGPGRPAGGRRRGAVLRLLRVPAARPAELGVRPGSGRARGRDHPVRALRGGGDRDEDTGRAAVRLDRRRVPVRAGAARGDGALLRGRDAGGLVADSSPPSWACCRPASTSRCRRRSGARPSAPAWGASASSSSARGWPGVSTRSHRAAPTWPSTSRSFRRMRRNTAGAGSASASGTSRWDTSSRSSWPSSSCCWRPSGSIRARWPATR